jgi:hypothetical protein
MMSLELPTRKPGTQVIPVEIVTPASKWSRLNQIAATFGDECLVVGWL